MKYNMSTTCDRGAGRPKSKVHTYRVGRRPPVEAGGGAHDGALPEQGRELFVQESEACLLVAQLGLDHS